MKARPGLKQQLHAATAHGHQPTTILTGGDASRILDASTDTPLHRPHLVLQGLAHRPESAQ